jgi:hypothetical protein
MGGGGRYPVKLGELTLSQHRREGQRGTVRSLEFEEQRRSSMRRQDRLAAMVMSFLLVVVVPCAAAREAGTTAFPKLTGPYLGQEPPGDTPEVFAPGIVSTGMTELNSVFSPDGREFYYAVDTGPGWALMVTRLTEEGWSEPEVLPFTREYSGVDLALSADGQRMFYCSNRPRGGRGPLEDNYDIWYVDRAGDGSWSEPVNLEAVNSDADELYPCPTADGALYLQSGREGSAGRRDLYRFPFKDGKYGEAENLGPVVNSPGTEGDVFVAPDESYIVFFSRGHDRGENGSGLFVSFRDDSGSWTSPRNLGLVMEGDRSDFCPMLSPDGKYFFFSSARTRVENAEGNVTWQSLWKAQSQPRNGRSDIYWIDAGVIEKLR